MQNLGELASLGFFPALAWMVRHIVRDILDYRKQRADRELKRQMLQRVPDDQVASVIRESSTDPGAAQQ